MIDPETARQAWDDAKAEPRYESDPFAREAGLERAGDALAVLVPQLLDQLRNVQDDHEHTYARLLEVGKEKTQLLDQLAEAREHESVSFAAVRADRRALGERCHQLETALERTLFNFEAVLARRPVRDATETIAEARAALGDTPPRPTCDYCGSFKHRPEHHGDPAHWVVAVEPPQPETVEKP